MRQTPPRNRRRATRRRLLAFGLLIPVVLLGFLATVVFVVGSGPNEPTRSARRYPWILGPSPARLALGARSHIDRAVEALNDTELPAANRIQTYRQELQFAESLMERSLRAQPAQARNLAILAAVRWELYAPTDPRSRDQLLQIIAHASDMAPLVPRVQFGLGDLLLKMNRVEAAGEFFRRTIHLDGSVTPAIVASLEQHLVPAEQMRDLLPDLPEVIVELEPVFRAESRHETYLEILDQALVRWDLSEHPRLLRSYTDACLGLAREDFALRRLDEIGELDDSLAEATRLIQRGRVNLALDRPGDAGIDARTVLRLQPDAPFFLEKSGRLLHLAGASDEAIAAYRSALPLLARRRGSKRDRARLYRLIGQVEETRTRWSAARDAYRLAVSLNSEESFAKNRLRDLASESGNVTATPAQDESAEP